MPQTVRIANAHGFWGDRIEAARETLEADPHLDYLTLDFLAEVSLSIMASQQERDPTAGYARDFLDVVESLIPYWNKGGGCRVVTNAGGLNPRGCADACKQILSEAGIQLCITVVTGDNVLPILTADYQSGIRDPRSNHLDTGERVSSVIDRMMTANAYLGAKPIAAALQQGADLVITGRTADPSLTVGPCLHHFGWREDEFDRIAGATIAGHLIECGTQVTGGVSTEWLSVPSVENIGFPIVEVAEDGSCIVTKAVGSGGRVDESIVKEQLLYEIGDPDNYLSPDATVSFLSLTVNEVGKDRVQVSGARGAPPPDDYKVSATHHLGYRAAGQLTIVGNDARLKAQRAAEIVMTRLSNDGFTFQQHVVETIGSETCKESGEVVMRIAVGDSSRAAVEQFTRAMMPLITCGPQGTTGYSEGRPRVHPMIGYWPCLIERDRVHWEVQLITPPTNSRLATSPAQRGRSDAEAAGETRRLNTANYKDNAVADSDSSRSSTCEPTALAAGTEGAVANGAIPAASAVGSLKNPLRRCTKEEVAHRSEQPTLADFAFARSGDKGINANIGIIARHERDFDSIKRELTTQRVALHLQVEADDIVRYELPNLSAINFVIHGILRNPLCVDAQGKTLGQVLLRLPLRSAQTASH